MKFARRFWKRWRCSNGWGVDSRVFFHEAFTLLYKWGRVYGLVREDWIETWPRWDKRYSIESKLCYSSSLSLWLISIHRGKWFWMASFCWRRHQLSFLPTASPICIYFVDALVSTPHNALRSVPNIAEIASSPALPSLLCTDVVDVLTLQTCASFAPWILLFAVPYILSLSNLWSTS